MGPCKCYRNRLDAPLAGWNGEFPVTRHIDSYWCVMGAMPLVNPWWELLTDHTPKEDIWGENPRKWINWYVSVRLDRDFADDVDPLNNAAKIIDHNKIMSACHAIVNGIPGHNFRNEIIENASFLITGDIDDVDFDSDTADVVLQIAVFGKVIFS